MVFFLTGTTGFVGGELLIRFSQNPEIEKIYCLVRADSFESGLARVKKVFALYNDQFDDAKIIPVIGDLTDSDLSGKLAQTKGLASVTHILHSAANTSFAKIQDESVEAINIGGLARILTWAKSLKSLSLFTYVGTATICGCNVSNRLVCEDESPNTAAKHLVRYTYSKMVGELSISDYLPNDKTLILRPSIIMGDSRDRKPRSNVILWTLAAANFLRLIPVNPEAKMDIIPIDYVVNAIAAIIFAKRSHRVYHISAGPAGVTTPRQLTAAIAPYYTDKPSFEFIPNSYISQMKNWARGRLSEGSDLLQHKTHLDYLTQQLDGSPSQLRLLLAGFEPYMRFIELGHIFDNKRLLADTSVGQSVPGHEYVTACVNYMDGIDVFESALNP